MDIPTEHVPAEVAEPVVHVAQPVVHVAQHAAVTQQCLPRPMQGNMFLNGYIDCVQESLWFLTEVEKLPLDHPMVVGLKMKLHEQYGMLSLQYMLRHSLRMVNEVQKNEVKSDIENNNSSEVQNVIENDANDSVKKCAIQTDTGLKSEIDVRELPCSNGTEIVQKSASEVSNDVQENASSAAKISGLSPEEHRIALTLADEIFSLLQDQDDLDTSDDEEESIDEGFEEMILL